MLGYTVRKNSDGSFTVNDGSDNTSLTFKNIEEASFYMTEVLMFEHEEIDLALTEMYKNNHTTMEFGAFKGSFLYSA